MPAYIVVLLVALQRLGELFYAQRNTKVLLARGGVEIGAEHYPVIVALHAAWLVAIVISLPQPPELHLGWLSLFIVLQSLRLWVLAKLGPYWTTRIINVPGAPLIRSGPYRYVRHPNYAIVAAEIFVLPMVFGQWQIAVIFSLLNAGVLTVRIRAENAALAARRELYR